jgi:FkbM family methyltransferase
VPPLSSGHAVNVIASASHAFLYILRHPANRHRRLAAFRDAFAWQVHKRSSQKPWPVRLNSEVALLCWHDSTLGSAIAYTHGKPDFDELSFLERYLRPGDGFLDVGANIGLYSLFARVHVGSHGRVDAFEPGRAALDRLRRAVRYNGLENVFVHSSAVGVARGQAVFRQDQDQWNRLAPRGQSVGVSSSVVDVVTLNDAVREVSYSAAKIDVEGAEWLVLQGAEKLLAAQNPPVWILEWNALLNDYGQKLVDFADWLSRRGLDLMIYDGLSNQLRLVRTPDQPRRNVFAISRAALKQVLARLGATASVTE